MTEGIFAGWGESENSLRPHESKPKMISVQIHRNEDCVTDSNVFILVSSNRTFCAGLTNGSGVCDGDSGSGLEIKVNDKFYLKGIVSAGPFKDNKCDVLHDAIYTNVLDFGDWIKKLTGALAFNCRFIILGKIKIHEVSLAG